MTVMRKGNEAKLHSRRSPCRRLQLPIGHCPGVPEIVRVAASNDRPAGRPETLYVRSPVPPEAAGSSSEGIAVPRGELLVVNPSVGVEGKNIAAVFHSVLVVDALQPCLERVVCRRTHLRVAQIQPLQVGEVDQ